MKTFALFGLFLASVAVSASATNTPAASATATQGLASNYTFIINCTPPGPNQAGNNLHFEILVVSRTGRFSADSEGLLEIFDPEGRMFSCDVQRKDQRENLKYEFDLSPKYLTKSRFAFKCTGVDEKGSPLAEVLWVQLKNQVKPSLQ